MDIRHVIDNLTSFIIDPSNHKRTSLGKKFAWATTLLVGFATVGIIHIASVGWRKLRHVKTNETQEMINRVFRGIFSKEIQPIDKQFTAKKSIAEQQRSHNTAKNYLISKARKLGADVDFVSPTTIRTISGQKVENIKIDTDLDPLIFSWTITNGVQQDIQMDGRMPGQVVIYGVASQFNCAESIDRSTPLPGEAVRTYFTDNTQGPAAQLQFPDQQVELINDAANLGFNGLCRVLDDQTKTSLRHGYLTPTTKEEAELLIDQLQSRGDKIEYLCIGNIPNGLNNTEKVYEMLVAAPAFGSYDISSTTVTDQQKDEIQFLCALHGYRAQFQQAIKLANTHQDKEVFFKATTPGLGVFGNKPENIAKAFYIAAKEYEILLQKNRVQVSLQVFENQQGTLSDASIIASALGLQEKIL